MVYKLVTKEEIIEALSEASALDATRGYCTAWLHTYAKEVEVALRLQMRKTANDTVRLITSEATQPDQQK